MKRVSGPRKLVVALLAFTVLSGVSAGAIIAAGSTITIHAGNLVLHANVSMSPKTLPKNRMAPIVVRASGSAETADGTHIPPAKTLDLHVDKHMRVESTELPSCPARRVEATSPAQAMKACGGALVGKGVITAGVEFPESAPFYTRGPLLVFNGPATAAGPAYPDMLFLPTSACRRQPRWLCTQSCPRPVANMASRSRRRSPRLPAASAL